MKIPIILIIVFLFSTSCFAQKDIVVFTGVNARNTFFTNNENGFVDFYKNIAFNLSVGANFKVDKSALLCPTIEVNIYPFRTSSYPNSYNYDRYIKSVNISKAIIYRFLLGFKVLSSGDNSRQAYFLTGIGYSIEDFSIKVNWKEIIYETEKVKYKNTNYFVHLFGGGVIFSLNDNYAINIEGKIITDYEKFDNSLNVGLIFKKIDLGKILF